MVHGTCNTISSNSRKSCLIALSAGTLSYPVTCTTAYKMARIIAHKHIQSLLTQPPLK